MCLKARNYFNNKYIFFTFQKSPTTRLVASRSPARQPRNRTRSGRSEIRRRKLARTNNFEEPATLAFHRQNSYRLQNSSQNLRRRQSSKIPTNSADFRRWSPETRQQNFKDKFCLPDIRPPPTRVIGVTTRWGFEAPPGSGLPPLRPHLWKASREVLQTFGTSGQPKLQSENFVWPRQSRRKDLRRSATYF